MWALIGGIVLCIIGYEIGKWSFREDAPEEGSDLVAIVTLLAGFAPLVLCDIGMRFIVTGLFPSADLDTFVYIIVGIAVTFFSWVTGNSERRVSYSIEC